jgi:hypothetical protein
LVMSKGKYEPRSSLHGSILAWWICVSCVSDKHEVIPWVPDPYNDSSKQGHFELELKFFTFRSLDQWCPGDAFGCVGQGSRIQKNQTGRRVVAPSSRMDWCPEGLFLDIYV